MSDKGDQIIRSFTDHFDDVQKSIFEIDMTKSEVESIYLYEFVKTSYYGRSLRKIEASDGTNTESRFKLYNDKFDLLEFINIRAKIPAVQVKSEFKDIIQICWVNDLGINIIEEGKLKFGDKEISTIDNKYIYIHQQLFGNQNHKEFIQESIGNKPSLTQWNTFLHEDSVVCEQPWFYSRKHHTALPLYFCNQLSANHIYKFNTNIDKLLRMRRLNEDGVYEDIECDTKYIFVQDGITKLQTPEMYGMYIKLSGDEVNAYKCMTRDNIFGDFYITDIVKCISKNAEPFNKTISVDLDCDGVVNTMIWFAENITATKNGVLNNYTTNSVDRTKGYNPIEWSSLKVGSLELFSKLSNDHTSRLLMRDFNNRPIHNGLNVWSFCSDINSTDSQVGVNLRDIKLNLSSYIRDTNPYLTTLDPDTGRTVKRNNKNEPSPEFDLYVYLIVCRKISFLTSPDKVDDKWIVETERPEFRENINV